MNGYADLLAIDKIQERDARRDAKLSKIFMEEMGINNNSDIMEILKMYSNEIIIPILNELNNNIKILASCIDEDIYPTLDSLEDKIDELEERVNAFEKFYPNKSN